MISVLVLEDMPTVQAQIIRELPSWFPQTIHHDTIWPAENLVDAMTKLKENEETIKIAIIDVFMNNNQPDGIDAAVQAYRQGCLVIIHSAHDPFDYSDKLKVARAAGIAQYVRKESDSSGLKKAVQAAIERVLKAETTANGERVASDFGSVMGAGIALQLSLGTLRPFREQATPIDVTKRLALFEFVQTSRAAILANAGTAVTVQGTTLLAVFPDDTEGHGLDRALRSLRSIFETMKSDANRPLNNSLHFRHVFRAAVQPGRFETLTFSDRPDESSVLVGEHAHLLVAMSIAVPSFHVGTLDEWCTPAERVVLDSFGTLTQSGMIVMPEIEYASPQGAPDLICRRVR